MSEGAGRYLSREVVALFTVMAAMIGIINDVVRYMHMYTVEREFIIEIGIVAIDRPIDAKKSKVPAVHQVHLYSTLSISWQD